MWKLEINDDFKDRIRRNVLEKAKEFEFNFEDDEELIFDDEDIGKVDTIIQALIEADIEKFDVFEKVQV